MIAGRPRCIERKKGSGVICRNGPKCASHKWVLTRVGENVGSVLELRMTFLFRLLPPPTSRRWEDDWMLPSMITACFVPTDPASVERMIEELLLRLDEDAHHIDACAVNDRQFGLKRQWVRAPVGRPTRIGNASLISIQSLFHRRGVGGDSSAALPACNIQSLAHRHRVGGVIH
jgi:hypothetical protein